MRTRRLLLGVVTGGLLGWGSSGCHRENVARTEPPAPAAAAPAASEELAASPTRPAPATTWHRLHRLTRRSAPLVRYYAVRHPAAPDTAAPPADARLFDLTLKASEFFRIDPRQAAEVRGREGTIVRIPARALVDARQRPATSEVWVELKECYSLADLVLSNHVSATADGTPQQTAGMLLVRATAPGGRALQLAAGTALEVEMPEDKPFQPSWQLHYGLARRQQTTRWLAAQPVALPADRVYTTAETMPAFGSGPADLNALMRYPDAALQKHTKGLVFASFVVDEDGQVLNPHILRGLGDGCDEEVLRVLRYTSGRWVPGRRNGQPVKVKMTLPIRFAPDAGLLASTDTAVLPNEAGLTEAEDAPTGLPVPSPRGYASAQLGWLTWLRPLHTAEHAPLTVAVEPDEHTSMRLVVPGAPAVLQAEAEDGQYVFLQAPARQRAWLVGLRFTNGTPFLALREVVAGQSQAEELEFRETTLADLESALARLR
ncbi:hypothetical protein F0P96_13920 [Hymenobacter busanensis]|uniref:Uncharacterized protein n=1 Tax=Hymenobacter busanensis TaxID=2607656 RepID=A0A7L4ZZY3_9BACT|nr:energy transducer TonB [Hymenobacter busanensis]KAA9331340.1 hypothetical protein F0P96_13920 [Hymenobacter busanensis]QHJ08493.1 hypothetical protein GUY19_14845 [Hymenobacter busanensis]